MIPRNLKVGRGHVDDFDISPERVEIFDTLVASVDGVDRSSLWDYHA